MSGAATTAGSELPRSAEPHRGLPPSAGAGIAGLSILRAEWTKLRTTGGTGWLLAATTALTIVISAATVAATHCPAGASCSVDTTRLSLTGIEAAQALVAVLAVLTVCTEYSTGMIRTTFTAMPRRLGVLAGKAGVLTGLVLAAAVVAVAGCLLAGRLILPADGLTAARGFPLVSLAHGPTVRAAIGAVLYLALIGLLSLGVATILRDSAVAIGAVLGLLYIVPIIAAVVGNPVWQRRLERYGPTNAGLAIEDTTGLRHLPIGPWAGLGVLAAWTAAALLIGGLLLRLRDA
ncbi:MAG TPA: ABC transporter permease [Streptosporangiaceae bacterium]|nr:ABC transporter permease [Streptosporangiaceae bacterium]